jgi:hypothetical protein
MSDTRLPIVVGCTGHRDLREEDIPHLEESYRKILADLQSQYTSTPFIILTALAEGADRIVARVARNENIPYYVALPLERDLYEDDFKTEASRIEFRELLEGATMSFTTPLVHGATKEGIREHGPERRLQYAQVGAVVSRYSQIVIAFWDGVDLQKTGGTSNVLRFRLQGLPDIEGLAHHPLDSVDTGIVYQIWTPRQSNSAIANPAGSVSKLYPIGFDSDEQAERIISRTFLELNDYNREVLHHGPHLEADIEQSKKYFFPEALRPLLQEDERHTIDTFATVDALANRYQKETKSGFRGVYTLILAAAVIFDIYAHLYSENKVVLGGYLFTIVLAFLWYSLAKRGRFQTRYLDFRALAEGIRVQFWWQHLGMLRSVSDHYIRKQRSELDWIRGGLRTILLRASKDLISVERARQGASRERIENILKYWVHDQAAYFDKARHRDHHKHQKFERVINIFFYLAIGFAAIQIFIPTNHYIVVAIGISPIVAALIGNYLEKNALAGHIKQYDYAAGVFSRAERHLNKLLATNELHMARNFIFELGLEALAENGDWLLLHRERPLEVPKG